MNTKIKIVKGKILNGPKVEIDYKKQDPGAEGKTATGSEEHKSNPHPDLTAAFGALCMHAALLGELVTAKDFKEVSNNLFDEAATARVQEKFKVTGFTVVGEDEGVILTASKTLKNGKILSFNTPTLRYTDEGNEPYPHSEHLANAIEKCKLELELYLGGKFAVEPQLSLELDTQN